MSRGETTIRTRVAPILLTVCSLALVVALFSGEPRIAGPIFVSLVMLFPSALAALVVRGRRMAFVLLALALVLELSAWGVLAFSDVKGEAAGWPPAATWMLVGLGLVPLLLVGVGYPWSFERWADAEVDSAEPSDPRSS